MAQEQAQIQEAQALKETFKSMVSEMTPPAAPAAPPTPPVVTEPISQEPSKPAVSEPVKTPSFEEMLAEKSGGKYKSLDDIKPEVKEVVKQPEFKNEFLKKLYEYSEVNGGDPDEFLKIHSTNWDNVDAATLVKEQMKAENPKLSAEEVEKLFNHTYKQTEDALDEEKEIGALRLKTEAEKVREAKKAFQAANTVPKAKQDAEEAERLQAQKQQAWEQGVSEVLKDTKISHKVKLDVEGIAKGMEVEVDHVLDDTEKNQMSAILNNPNSIFSKYINKDGGVDMGALKKDMFMLNNMDKIIAKSAENAISQFIKKDLKNADFNPAARIPPATKDVQRQAEEKLANYLM